MMYALEIDGIEDEDDNKLRPCLFYILKNNPKVLTCGLIKLLDLSSKTATVKGWRVRLLIFETVK